MLEASEDCYGINAFSISKRSPGYRGYFNAINHLKVRILIPSSMNLLSQ